LVDKSGVLESYKRIDALINVPTFIYQIEGRQSMSGEKLRSQILSEISGNGLKVINNSLDVVVNKENGCENIFSIGYQNCEIFRANKFDNHFNRFYNKIHIEGEVGGIKNSIDIALAQSRDKRVSGSRINKSEDLIVDYLPNTLFVSNSRERSAVGFFKNISYGRSSENFCVPFDRKGVVLNFNRYLTEGKEIKISSEFQRSGLGLVSRGYDNEGKVVYGEAIELLPGKPVIFIGSESVRGIVVLSNNKNCGSNDRDNKDEFLLEVEVI
jgi:hypothetical protein